MAAANRPTTNQSMNPDNPRENTVGSKQAVGISGRGKEVTSQATLAGAHPRNLATPADIGALRSRGQKSMGAGGMKRDNDESPTGGTPEKPQVRSSDLGKAPPGGTRG